ncbi:MAG: hypothetical protein EGQ88_04605 [Prevotellamassilia timonensis]|nr:hypothetical protein [Prevotellamassilia timonensis]
MNIAKATYCVRRVCTILFVILSVLCLSWPLASMAKKRALLIGISHYPQTTKSNPCTWTNIHGSNDVRLLRGTLQKQGFRITTLTNAQATASHIRRALKRLCQQAAKGDMVVIHFSGHGQPFEDLSGDEADGWDEAIVPYDAKKCYSRTYTGQCHIIDDELERYINSLRTTVGPRGFVYVVLDACHMGGASRDESETDSAACARGTNVGFSPNGRTYIPRIDRRGHFTVKASPRMAGVCYIEYTNQVPLIGWALANVYLINNDELNALHTLDKLIELTAPQSLVQTKAIELRHKIRNRKKIFGLL